MHDNCTILRVYGTNVSPHVFPMFVPLKIGFLEVMWKLGKVEDINLEN